jgi:hypothetical protein
MGERREFVRIPVEIQMEIKEIETPEAREKVLKTKIKNISRGGVYLESTTFEVSAIVNFVLHIPTSTDPISAQGIVQFNDGRGTGIKFVNTDDKFSERLKDYIDHLES